MPRNIYKFKDRIDLFKFHNPKLIVLALYKRELFCVCCSGLFPTKYSKDIKGYPSRTSYTLFPRFNAKMKAVCKLHIYIETT